jgi:hypothetical protein
VTGDPAFADYNDGMEMLMPDWFDDYFIQAVVDVGAGIPDPWRRDPSRAEKPEDLARQIREWRPSA